MTRPALYSLVGLLVGLASAQSSSSDVITEDSYFYGLSPPYYPSPNGSGTGDWAEAYSKAKAFVDQLTLEEKVNLTGGVAPPNGCSGYIDPIPRMNFSGLCLSDAGNGLRSADFVSSWASGWSVGASWNRDLTRQRAVGLASEFVKKGVNIALGPVVGPLGRIAENGRNWEGFSNDPYLCGQLAYETILGMQSTGVITSLKHYIAYEQETYRNPDGNISSVSSDLDDRTMHELYLWPFQDAIKAGSGNIMCSYNRINGSWACQNSWTLNNLLKTELGFQGFVVSDWDGQHSGVASANAGLDMVMPLGSQYWSDYLVEAVNNGSVNASRLDDQATRIMATWYQMGQDSADYPATANGPGFGIPADLSEPHERVIGWNASYKDIVYSGAVEGHVLVKNTNNALPLKSPKLLSLYGYSAKAPDAFDYGVTGWNTGAYPLSPLDYYTLSNGTIVSSSIARNGTLVSGGGSGANQPAYISSPFEALTARAQQNYTALYWDFESTNPDVDQNTDACLVFANAYASESWDRPNVYDDYTDSIILNVASNCSNTIVVFHNAGVRLVDTFVDHPNITALIFAHVPGQDSGTALVNLLYGDENFSGKLHYSVPMNESDYGQLLGPALPEGIYEYYPQANFSEGVYIDYRAFDAQNITPRYEFGFGLSYTNFSYTDLSVSTNSSASTAAYPTGEIVEGGREDLWDILATVTATVANTGSVSGAEAAQLYVGIPNAPVRQLRGFDKPSLDADASATVTFELTRRDLSIWDATAQAWLLQNGSYNIYVGGSSRSLPLTGTLSI